MATSTKDVDAGLPAVVLWDHQNCLPLGKMLAKDDIITLLTPVVVPLTPDSKPDDPFEPFGRALAHRHPKVRHVPYTKRSGITSTHVPFIKHARVVIFVISDPNAPGEGSQIDLAGVARLIGEQRPQVIVACFSVQQYNLSEDDFPTIIQINGYTPADLEAAAEVLFGENATVTSPSPTPTVQDTAMEEVVPAPRRWEVDRFQMSDLDAVQELWHQSLPEQFHLDRFRLGQVLQRDGYAMHFVVREPERKKLVGFCATYTTFADSIGHKLTASIAMLLVEESFRGRGVGLSLHNHALAMLKRTGGVVRFQLGSTFPRILFGIPYDMPSAEWFQRRGWRLDQQAPGQGQEICDWLLRFEDLPQKSYTSAGLSFRACEHSEYEKVLAIVGKESARNEGMGWYDQYWNLKGSPHVEDVILGLDGDTIVATALTYIPRSGSPVGDDIPWALTIGDDVGGITCICIVDDNPDMVRSRDSVMIRLLDACIRYLSERGKRRLFIDGIRGGNEGFQSLGFQKWASYRDVWRSAQDH